MRVGSILEAAGGTPLVPLRRLAVPGGAQVYLKLERFNPGGSVKFRAALNMVRDAIRQGRLGKGGTIVESSSGNLGIALAMIGAAMGFRVVIVVDPRATATTRAVLQALGAEVVPVEQADPAGGFQVGRLARATELAAAIPGAVLLDQYANPANPQAYQAIARELVADLGRWPDHLVVAVSTAGQVSGLGAAVKEASPETQVIAVHPVGSAVFGEAWQGYLVRGPGLSWTPENLDDRVVDEVYQVSDEVAFAGARLLARHDGVLAGGSSGLVLAVALRMAARLGPTRTVVGISPDGGEKYLDEFYDDQWLARHGLDLRDWTVDRLHRAALGLTPSAWPALSRRIREVPGVGRVPVTG